jgi:serine O-acetyltransferase
VLSIKSAVRRAAVLFVSDAARWVRPQEVALHSEVSGIAIAKLLLRHPPLRAMAWFRLGGAMSEAGIRGGPSWVQRRLLRLYGLELPPGAPVGGGLYIAHPVACVLVAERIGENVTVIGQATFGTREDERWPVIEDDVFVGVGARILGGIRVGQGAKVAANAVVLRDVEPGATVAGVPARTVGASDGRDEFSR